MGVEIDGNIVKGRGDEGGVDRYEEDGMGDMGEGWIKSWGVGSFIKLGFGNERREERDEETSSRGAEEGSEKLVRYEASKFPKF
jgi:hypothetical protein